ncbi:hypothetical protein B0T10DRAFT_498039 [Thelonectria olida]|uniref:DNA damage-responsive protein 48 n=1 Tax=Thelonectria olida TaxID=1576542 RepID=A0A9P8VT54_9HYPO|nr:hypothetical protein B0T10DRAFT_498039 [Thelonectria olida]
MDILKNITGGGNSDKPVEEQQQKQEGQSGGGFMDKINGMAGGGAQGEKNEDGLDKAVDFVQEKVFGQGDQSNESAAEQAKDEAMSDFIRDKYKDTTGKDFFVKDKDKDYGV